MIRYDPSCFHGEAPERMVQISVGDVVLETPHLLLVEIHLLDEPADRIVGRPEPIETQLPSDIVRHHLSEGLGCASGWTDGARKIDREIVRVIQVLFDLDLGDTLDGSDGDPLSHDS